MTSSEPSTDRGELLSMLAMAGMFVVTILLGLLIRPFYDANQLQAFGEAGATQVRFILLELTMILVFTAAILFLVRLGAQWVIRYGILAILTLALVYATVPMAHVLLVDDLGPDSFVTTAVDVPEGEVVGSFGIDDAIFASLVDSGDEDAPLALRLDLVQADGWTSNTTAWSVEHAHSPMSDERLVRVVSNGFGSGVVSMTNGAYVWTVGSDGTVVEGTDCFEMGEQGPVETIPCGTALLRSDDLYVVDAADVLWRYVGVEDAVTGETVYRQQAAWQLPSGLSLNNGFLSATQLGADHLMLVSETMVTVVLLEATSDGILSPFLGSVDNATTLLVVDRSDDGATPFTTATVGPSPWAEGGDDLLLWVGDADGTVLAWRWNASWAEGDITELDAESRLHMDGLGSAVLDLVVSDIDGEGGVEVWVLQDGFLNMHAFQSLTRMFEAEVTGTSLVVTSVDDVWTAVTMDEDGVQQGEVTGAMFLSSGIAFDGLATTIGLIAGLVLVVLLYVHSEWYVVNTVGLLVGAGVITMLGVSFAPPLLILFMVAAAVYDAWAVYRSKHMLELADTMIGMRLPILLVAPQTRNYSYIEDSAAYGDGRFTDDRPDVDAQGEARPTASTSSGGSREAMFMGLGDVIFPGMLVVSAVQYLGGSDGFLVAMCTMLGGLLGYAVLMRAVATGRAQAGLPLLNGGAILGYVFSGLAVVGGAVFNFGISL